jgi:sulfate transport system substrate-binding protein
VRHRHTLPVAVAVSFVVAALALAGCGSSSSKTSAATSPTTDPAFAGAPLAAAKLSIVAYSTPQEAYTKIISAFQKTPVGKNITFTESYGASGDQSRAVVAGLPADIVAFSLETDVTRLVKANLVASDWNSDQYKGIVTDSVVVIGTRKGNPKGLKDWEDLTKPGISVITPNPFTSGGARWNVLAAYGAASDKGTNDQAGVNYLKILFQHVPVQDDSGRKSLQTFTTGKGNAFLSYENEAVFAQQHQQAVDYTIPDRTILIENPVAVTKGSTHQEAAKKFVEFLRSATAQRIFADAGYRPVVAGVAKPGEFKTPARLFTITDLGGWDKVTKRFFDPDTGILVDVEHQLGVPTKK